MPSDLRERIVGMVDTAAPPVDVESLAQQLAGGAEQEEARRAPTVPPLRRRIWAFAGTFTAVLVLVGGALAAGAWLHEPETSGQRGFSDTSAPGTAAGDWWWLALIVVVLGIGAVAVMASRRRSERPEEEDAMQTMEKRTESKPQPDVDKLKKQRRWLVTALALVLVVGAVAIGWLIAENRSLSSDLDTAMWPAESELTPRGEYMVDATERFWSAWNEQDFDTIMGLYASHAVHGAYNQREVSPVDSEHRSDMERIRPRAGEYSIVQIMVVGSFVVHVIETDAGYRESHTFRFAPGTEPLIVSSYYGAASGGS